MKIAIAADGNGMNSIIPDQFEAGSYLLIYETDDGSCEVFLNPESSRSTGLAMTEKIIQKDCEALISGSIDKLAFEKLAMAQITRYDGAGLTAQYAIDLMEENRLGFFRVPRGEVWVAHNHGHHTCSCGNE